MEVGSIAATEVAKTWFGLSVQKLTPEAARRYKLSSHEGGVLIVKVEKGSSADKAELERGDLIISMSRESTGVFRSFEEIKINDLNDFRKFVSSIKNGQRIRIIFERKGDLWQTYLTAAKE